MNPREVDVPGGYEMFGVLVGDLVVPYGPDQVLEWARHPRWRMTTRVGGALVSTVFLGMNHAPPGWRPEWFETMVFSHGEGVELPDEVAGLQWRYETMEQAYFGHDAAATAVEGILGVEQSELWEGFFTLGDPSGDSRSG